MRRGGLVLTLAAAMAVSADAVAGQVAPEMAPEMTPRVAAPLAARSPGFRPLLPPVGRAGGPPELLTTPVGAFAASLAIPGSGQAALGVRRWPLYLLAEAGFWWLWADARSDFHRSSDGYRDLAWNVARIPDGPRRDGAWSYYETMSHYVSSGAFDADAAAGLQPEEDPETWNGTVWEIARGIYLPGGVADPTSPGYEDALAWYRGRAAGPGFLWSWAGRGAELTRFRALIGSADDARRTQTTALGLILANHLVSAIDALLVARMRAPVQPELRGAIVPGPTGPAWRIELRFPLAN